MSKNWLAVASAEHVRLSKKMGIMQVCNGKLAPLKRITPNDFIIYYSPTDTFKGKDKLQSFTAIGIVKPDEPYQVVMDNFFRPFRRNVQWARAREIPIAPLCDELELTWNKKGWGYQLRYGLISLSDHDKSIIATAMRAQWLKPEGEIMIHITPQLIKVNAFTVMGYSERTKNSVEFDPQTAKLAQLWKKFYSAQIPGHKPDSPVYGVYSGYESDHNGFYTVIAGVEISLGGELVGFETVGVKEGDYLVFKNSGSMPQAIIETWQAIWHYFDNKSDFSRTYETDFEMYIGQGQCAVYIGVKR
ncbi:EVE domain-containing protein [Fluoribacter dumoffii]|uniref:UPF0310 protein NCTC11370_01477 n=1 Tax=Fluoribacter dumoffii TaxID=463 RepID=A0A377GAB0_9GAMM|nr:effector binding domain-containing protein [Fluoribacter dumoffii]KTC90290.1 hypothetical protein Ldum_1358 [Fluoribacter dumoffii NY 23]MCW8385608.1 EVE domain-containing protein [Fluoribacter dumoffii]MCW8496097.1 EVE domain-containing protein [Fluoribacter dumoffii]STO21410.1 Bacterial transcription activator, effector binding domain [Fluoribacter dumoffii]